MTIAIRLITLLLTLLSTSQDCIAKCQGNLPSLTSLTLPLRTNTNPRFPTLNPRNSSEVFFPRFSQKMVVDMLEPLREIRDGYLMSLNLGTPAQVVQVYLDTGSDLTWVPCGNLTFDCMDCDDFRSSSSSYRANSAFSPSYSSSALRDGCLSPFCSNVHSSDNPYDPCIVAGCSLATSLKGTCARPCPPFAYTYGAGGVVTGSLSRDTLRLHGTNPNVIREVPRFTFGCVGSTYHEPIGIAGFGRGPLSIPSQLGFLHKGFSHCFLGFKYANNPNFSSPLVVGDAALSSKETMEYTPMLRSSVYPNYYYIGLEGLTVGNTDRIQVPSILTEFDPHGNGGFLIDSGTTYTHFPQPFFKQILTSVQSEMMNYPRANDMESRTGFHLCYKVPVVPNVDGPPIFPSITFHFLNNASLTLPSGNSFYTMSAPLNSTVVKCLLFRSTEDDDDEGGKYEGPAGVFGSFQQQNVEVVYDLENDRIGFQPMDCASASASQGIAHKERILPKRGFSVLPKIDPRTERPGWLRRYSRNCNCAFKPIPHAIHEPNCSHN